MAKLKLDKVLKEKGITKYGFAKALDLKPPSVQQFFREGYNPKLQTMAEWAVALDCEISDLFDESKNRPKATTAIPTKTPSKK
jgi:DNA-binding XRE family transcriptional regulator